ncbi:MAG: CARDB domain-containing protein, partial [Thermodesulfobacteriota bacterium]
GKCVGTGCAYRGGGGSGGSIHLTAGTLAGAGAITADGGNGGSTHAGGGAGGRVAVYYGDIAAFPETHITVTGGTGFQPGAAGTIHLQPLEAPYLLSHAPDGPVNHPVTFVDVTFHRPIDGATFTAEDVRLSGPAGEHISVSGDPVLHEGNTWRISFDPQHAEGEYVLLVGPHILGPTGLEMDQDGDRVGGEDPDDVYRGTFTIDTTAPRVVSQSPSGNWTQHLSFVDVGFSEAIAPASFRAQDVTVAGPLGPIPAGEPEPLGGNVWRIPLPAQSTPGDYSIGVGPAVSDLAGNAMGSAYQGTLRILLPDLVALELQTSPAGGTGGHLAVSWRVANSGSYHAGGPWKDCLYLSSDPEAGGGTALGCYEHSPNLAVGASYDRLAQVVLPPVPAGSYWVHLRVDAEGRVAEADGANNAASAGPVEISRPNLVAGALAVPPEVWARQSIAVTWAVSNDGLVAASGSWQDCLYLSPDDQPGADVLLGCAARPAELAPGASYEQSIVFPLPNVTKGTYWVVLAVDAAGSLAEADEADNGAVSPPVLVHREFRLATGAKGWGTVVLDPSGPDYEEGTAVHVTAVPQPDWVFSQWEGALAGAGNPATLSMDADKSVTAVFVLEQLLPNPTGVAVTPHSGYVDISWAGVEPAQYVKHYAVYVGEADFTSVEGMTPRTTRTVPGAKVAGLTNNRTYYVAVTAVNLSGGETKEVATVPATPVPDTEGPAVSNVRWEGAPLAGGQVLRKPGTVTLTASDPAGMSRVEFRVDGVLKRTDTSGSGSYSFAWNLVAEADGARVLGIAAYDTLGNATGLEYTVTVALDPPGAPVITQPVGGITTNKATVAVSGTAEKDTEVLFYRDGTQVALVPPAAVTATGAFSASVPLA